MKFLLTGATGFLGSHVARALVQRGDTVVAYKRPQSDLTRVTDLADRVGWFDLEEHNLNKPFEMQSKIDAVIHMATNYGRKGESAATMTEVNLRFPAALYELCQNAGVDSFLNLHTALPRDLNPYSLSKHRLVDQLALSTGSTRIRHLRMEHFYGPGDHPEKFIEWLFRELRAGRSIPLTKGEQQRDFLYIDDTVSAILECLDPRNATVTNNEMLDVGSGEAITIRDLAELCKELAQSGSVLDFGAVPYRENEVMKSVADVSRLRALGWAPTVTLVEGLRRVAERPA